MCIAACRGDIIFLAIVLILFVMQSLAYSLMYLNVPLSCIVSIFMCICGMCAIFWILDKFQYLGWIGYSSDDDDDESVDNITSYRWCCNMTCQSLFICNIYITHVHDSDVKSVVTRLAILIACHFVFILLMYFARNLYDALKWCLKDACAEKLNIVWVISYIYILISAIMMMLNSIPFGISSLSDFEDKVAIIIICISTAIGYCVCGFLMMCWQVLDFVPYIYTYPRSLILIQITSVVTFILNIIFITVANVLSGSKLKSDLIIMICGFIVTLVENIIILVVLLLLHGLILCCIARCRTGGARCASSDDAADSPDATTGGLGTSSLDGETWFPADVTFYFNDVLPQYENLDQRPYDNLDPPPYQEPLDPPPYQEPLEPTPYQEPLEPPPSYAEC
jgi:hypothetical protein